MNTLEKMQLKERLSGTLLRLGWLVAILTFVPALLYFTYGAMAVGRILFIALLLIIALCTLFLIFLVDGFRNLFEAGAPDMLPMVQNVYDSYKVLIFILLAVGVILGVLTILLAVKQSGGKSSKRKIISSSFMMVFLLLGAIVYMATKSKIMGV